MRRPILVAFEGERPAVGPGDPVECRTVTGGWRQMVARSEPRYDTGNALGGRCYLTVAVSLPGGRIVNWPAEAVRRRAALPEDGTDG